MIKVAILGCGWLGFPLAKQLLKNGFHVNGSTTSPEKISPLNNSGISGYQIDLENITATINTFLNADELIITIPPKAKNYAALIENLLPKIAASTIKRVTYTSSISVYGNTKGVITEDAKTIPTRASVEQIIEVEQLLLNSKNFNTNIIRLGGLIGGNRHPAYHVSGKQLKAPNELVNLIHLDDCIAVVQQLLKTNIPNNIFNLVNPYHPTKSSYYAECCNYLKLPTPIITNDSENRSKEISSKKIIILLNYKFKNNLILS
jgi:nucleoside-diphosphate-sugar epimerase